jgi:hypothetical protein
MSYPFLQVDCTQKEDLCKAHDVTGYPSIRVFRNGRDDIYYPGKHESYSGDRTKEDLVNFADILVASAASGELDVAPTEVSVS